MGLSGSTGIRSLSLNKYDRRIKKYNGKVLEAGMGYTIPKKESTIDDTCLVHRERKISIAGGLSSTTAWLPIATESVGETYHHRHSSAFLLPHPLIRKFMKKWLKLAQNP